MLKVQEIIRPIIAHMIEGLMFHEKLSVYFNFLGFPGYSMLHEYHYIEENKNYKDFYNFIISFCCCLIPDSQFKNPDVIPSSWFDYEKKNIDNEIRKNGLKKGFERWLEWEEDTIKLYSDTYTMLIRENMITIAEKIKDLILDVSEEIVYIKEEMIKLETINCDLSEVMNEQQEIRKKYKKKRGKLFK